MNQFKSMVALALTLLMWRTPVDAANIAFNFDTEGLLPTAQGAIYITGPGEGVPENNVFSTSSGLLTQATAGRGASYAYYGVNGFDHAQPAVLEWRLRLSPTSIGNTAIALTDNAPGSRGFSWEVFLSPTNVSLFQMPEFAFGFDTTDAMHTYRLVVPPGGSSFELFVDGASRLAGMTTVTNASPDAALLWGDVSSSDGDTFAQWDFIRLTNEEVTRLSIDVAEVRLCWNSITNKAYQIQYRSELTGNAWVNWGAPIAGNGATNCVTDAVVSPTRYYQILTLP